MIFLLNPVGALTTDSNSTPSQLIEDWHASNERDHAANHSLQQEQQKDIDSQVKQQEHEEYQQIKPDHQTELTNMSVQQGNPSTDPQHLQKDPKIEKVLTSNPQESSVLQGQQDKQKLSENQQQVSMSDQASNQMKRAKSGSVPFTVLIPVLRPHLDKDRNMQLDVVFDKLRVPCPHSKIVNFFFLYSNMPECSLHILYGVQSNEITKEHFLRVIRNIVGDTMLRQAAQKVQSQVSNH